MMHSVRKSLLPLLLASVGMRAMARAQQSEDCYVVTDSGYPSILTFNTVNGETGQPTQVSGSWSQNGITWGGTGFLSLAYVSTGLPQALVAIHPANASSIDVGPCGFDTGQGSIERDPVSGRVYALADDFGGAPGRHLWRIDVSTGQASLIATIHGATNSAVSLAIDHSGNAFIAQGIGPKLYSLDLQSGNTSLVATFTIGNGLMLDLAFAPDGGLFGAYWDSTFNFKRGIYRLFIPSQGHTKIGTSNTPYMGIVFAPKPLTEYYCVSKQNSIGCLPRIRFVGYPSPTAASGFHIIGSDTRNNLRGLLLYSVTGRANVPFGGGILCIQPPFVQSPITSSGGNATSNYDCSGVWNIDFNSLMAPSYPPNGLPQPTPPYVPGTTVNCQWWGRDSGFPVPNNVSLSDALEFTLLP